MAKIFADVMLAKLARWLRFAGISVYNVPFEDDTRILGYVKRSKGVLLTADEELSRRARRARIGEVLISEKSLEGQIAQAANALGDRVSTVKEKTCPICNSDLKRVNKEKVAGLVPPEAYARYCVFYFCGKCNKAYWHGTHWKDIAKTLRKASELQKKIR